MSSPKRRRASARSSPTDELTEDQRGQWQQYLLGQTDLTPAQKQKLLGFDPATVREIPSPVEPTKAERAGLRRWAAIEVLRGKFPADRSSKWEEGRLLGIDSPANAWLMPIAGCWRELFRALPSEDDLLGYLFRVHGLPPADAGALSLERLAGLLRRDCEARARPATSVPTPADVTGTPAPAATPEPNKPQKKRGRKPKGNPKQDEKLLQDYEASGSGEKVFARDRGQVYKEVRDALKRAREKRSRGSAATG